MPTRRYALKRGEPKRLELISSVRWTPLTIRLDGQEVGSIQTMEQLKSGKTFLLSDGSQLRVELAKRQLLVLRNGTPVPGSSSDPLIRLRGSYGCLFAVGGLVALVGLGLTILAITQSADSLSSANETFIERYGVGILDLGIGLLVFGGVYLLLGFFVQRRSKVALGIAVGLICIDLALNSLALLAGNCSVIAGLPIQIGILITLWRGFDAIRELQEEQGGVRIPAGASRAERGSTTDWESEGQKYYQAGSYSAALSAYEMALKANPWSGRIWRYKGDALAALGRSAEAESAYQEARARGEVW